MRHTSGRVAPLPVPPFESDEGFRAPQFGDIALVTPNRLCVAIVWGAFMGGEGEANASRLADCWNALEGIADPSAVKDAIEALRKIEALKPEEFDGFPADWSEQVAACSECQRYKGHPIQQGICDEHRRPFYERERHDACEVRAIGPRARIIARDALAKLGGAR